MHEFSFHCTVNAATYFSPINSRETSCLDHIWHNFLFKSQTFIISPPIADHLGVASFLDYHMPETKKTIQFRCFNDRNINLFLNNLSNVLQPLSENLGDTIVYGGRVLDCLTQVANHYFPFKRKTATAKRFEAPWITQLIMRCINKKHYWLKLLKRRVIYYSSFKSYCSLLNKLLSVAEKKYYESKFDKLGSNSKKNWRLLNSFLNKDSLADSKPTRIIVDGVTLNGSKQIANAFSDHFISKPQRLHNSVLNPVGDYLHLVPFINSSIYMCLSSPGEVVCAIQSLKKTGLLHDVPPRMLRLGVNYFAPLISKLFNSCLDHGVFPDAFKFSKITPLFKKGSRHQIENYRPISILSNLNKIFEKLMHTRLSSFFESRNVISCSQFGFRPNSNTELATLKLLSRIIPAFYDKSYAIAVYLDFSAAFDTVGHGLLIKKLWRSGIRGIALNFIESYFTNRYQEVIFNGCTSDSHRIQLGVLQGSVLGPMFFNLYTNDINFLLNNCDPILYADDTTLIFLSDDIMTLTSTVNIALARLFDWCNYNHLVLNRDKTKCMLFTPRVNVAIPNIYLNGTRIDFVDSFKFLGIHLDKDLKFNVHIESLIGQLSRLCGTAFRLRDYFNISTAKSFYYAYFYSVASYNICVWGGLFACTQQASFNVK